MWITGSNEEFDLSEFQSRQLRVLTLWIMSLNSETRETSMGYSNPMGNYPPRHTLSPALATALTEAHHQTGGSYRRVAAAIGITHPYWWRLCRGERAPTTNVAFRIIDTLGLDADTADLLFDECVDRGDSR